jgi:uncharacterized NAD-dependent epimerase/dehydratase family protein
MNRRLLILADGALSVFGAKTATCLLHFRPHDIAGVLDREHAGRTTREVLGVAAAVPIVATIEEGLALGPDTLVIGIAPPGGRLPEEWRDILRRALRAGLGVMSGLHTFLGDDPELAALAREHGAAIIDYRRPPEGEPIAERRVLATRARRLLTVGTDCSVGKMVTTFKLFEAARARGLDARIVPTGQTGMMIAGHGITLDRVPADFTAGWTEHLVLEYGGGEVVIVEGQGSLLHPAYSGVTLSLLHGCLPDAMVLCHHAGRRTVRYQTLPIPPLADWVRRYEDILAPLHPGRVAGLSINPAGLSPAEARDAIRRAEDETGLPAADVLQEGAGRLLDAALAAAARVRLA